MQLSLVREHGTPGYTMGKLFINGEFFCDTLEDEERQNKVYGKTAIPLGHYKLIVNQSVRFKKMMPLLLNVPNFSGVRMHSGNTTEDTDGCILVGLRLKYDFITKSRDTFDALMQNLNHAIGNREAITIEIS